MRNLTIALAALFGAIPAAASTLGAYSNFSVFTAGAASVSRVNSSYDDIARGIAIGGNANLTRVVVGSSMSQSGGTRNDIIVGGNLTYNNISATQGNVRYAGTLSTTGTLTQGNGNGIAQQSGIINFVSSKAQLQSLATSISNLTPTATAVLSGGNQNVTFTATQAGNNVFTIDSQSLYTANGTYTFNAGAFGSAATFIINVTSSSGSNIVLDGASWNLSNGASASNILWNVSSLSTFRAGGTNFYGTILGANTNVIVGVDGGATSNFNGQILADTATVVAQMNNVTFAATITGIPLPPAVWAGMGLMGAVAVARRRRLLKMSRAQD